MCKGTLTLLRGIRAAWLLSLLLFVGCASSTRVTPPTSTVRRTITEQIPAVERTETITVEAVPHDADDGPVEVEVVGKQVKASPGSTVTVEVAVTESTSAVEMIREDEAKATGPGLFTKSDKIAQEMKVDPPTVAINGTEAAAGGLAYEGELTEAGSGVTILYVMGGLCIIAGIGIVILAKRAILGFGIVGAGLLLMAVARLLDVYPWVTLVGLAVAVGLVIWFVLDARASRAKDAALRTIVRAVEKTPDSQAVKDNVKAEAGEGLEDTVKDVVTKIKRQEGLA